MEANKGRFGYVIKKIKSSIKWSRIWNLEKDDSNKIRDYELIEDFSVDYSEEAVNCILDDLGILAKEGVSQLFPNTKNLKRLKKIAMEDPLH